MQDIAQALSNSLDRNGYGGMRSPLNMGGFPIQNVLPGSSAGDVATVGQLTSIPVGTVSDFAGSTAPTGWLLCYGQAISRTAYASLFATIGTTYGTGDGSTTFNIPDCRGRVSAGKDDMGGTSANRLTDPLNGDNLGNAGGTESVVLSESQMPSHSHSGTTSSEGDHTHSGSLGVSFGGSWPGGSGFEDGRGAPDWQAGSMGSAGAHTHNFTTAETGGGQSHPNVQPTIIFNKIIKAS